MTAQEIEELAAILVNEHGHAALNVAERRRGQHADKPRTDAFRLWTRIAAAVARRLGARQRERA
jgi:hypothetical protein